MILAIITNMGKLSEKQLDGLVFYASTELQDRAIDARGNTDEQ